MRCELICSNSVWVKQGMQTLNRTVSYNMMTKLNYELILKSDHYEPEGLLITASSSSQESIKILSIVALRQTK